MQRCSSSPDWRSYPDSVKELLFLFAVLPGSHTPRSLAEYIRVVTGRVVRSDGLRAGIQRLRQDDYVIMEYSRDKLEFQDERYRCAEDLEMMDLRILGELAQKLKWWPARSMATDEAWVKWANRDIGCSVDDKDNAFMVWSCFEVMRSIFGGDERMSLDLDGNRECPVSAVYWAAFACLSHGYYFSAKEMFGGAAASVQSGMLLHWIEYGFMTRISTGNVLPLIEMIPCLKNGKNDFNALFIAMSAYCVWTGARRVFEEVACSSNLPKLDDVAVTFREMCRDLFAGRFEEAAEKYSAIEGALHKEEILDISTPVALIGLALAVRGKALGRMEKSSDGTDMFDLAFTELMREVDYGKMYPGGSWRDFSDAVSLRKSLVNSMVDGLLAESEQNPYDAEQCMQDAVKWSENGYASVSSALLPNVRRLGMKQSKIRVMESMERQRSAVEFFKNVRDFNTWEDALRSLSSILPKKRTVAPKEKKVAKLNGTIGWHLSLMYRNDGDDRNFECTGIAPIYRGPRASESGKDDKDLTARGLANPKYQDCMTEADAGILKAMQRKGITGRYDSIRVFPEDILKLLAGHPFVRVDVIFHGRKEKGIPATIEYRSCEVTTTEGKAGDLVLSLPDGVVGTVVYPKPTLVRTGEATFTYYAMNKKELEVATVFADEGRDGVIAVPRSGIDKVKDVLERIAGCMPVAGSVACGVNADGELPEMLKGSVNFKIECSSAILRDCYADTGEIGYEVHGWDTRLLGCSYFNNKYFNLDNITIIKHTRGRLLVESGAFVKTTPNYKVYVGTGEVEWRNMMYSGFDSKDDCPGALYR